MCASGADPAKGHGSASNSTEGIEGMKIPVKFWSPSKTQHLALGQRRRPVVGAREEGERERKMRQCGTRGRALVRKGKQKGELRWPVSPVWGCLARGECTSMQASWAVSFHTFLLQTFFSLLLLSCTSRMYGFYIYI